MSERTQMVLLAVVSQMVNGVACVHTKLTTLNHLERAGTYRKMCVVSSDATITFIYVTHLTAGRLGHWHPGYPQIHFLRTLRDDFMLRIPAVCWAGGLDIKATWVAVPGPGHRGRSARRGEITS